MSTVHFYGVHATRNGVPKKFVGTPFIVDEEGRLDGTLSRYFLARRNGDYVPGEYSGTSLELHGVRATQCGPVYLRNRAYQLDVYRRWCNQKNIVYTEASASQIERFASDYESGRITGASGIKPSSTNQVLTSVIDFLSYCVAIGLRKKLNLPFKVLNIQYSSSSRPFSFRARNSRKVKQYLVRRRENPRDIVDWSNFEEIEQFLEGFDGSQFRLGAEIIYACGLRLSELLNTTIHTFPTPEEWKASRRNRYIEVVGKYGKQRSVEVELEIVRKVHSFIDTQRKKNITLSGRKSAKLLIGPNGPVAHRMFQRAVKAVATALGMEHLCPHMLRHHYAAHFLLRAWNARRFERPYNSAEGMALLGHELIRLQQNLGHSNLETTCGYLNALGYLAVPKIAEELQADLESK